MVRCLHKFESGVSSQHFTCHRVDRKLKSVKKVVIDGKPLEFTVKDFRQMDLPNFFLDESDSPAFITKGHPTVRFGEYQFGLGLKSPDIFEFNCSES